MVWYDVIQGSDDWYELRKGRPTSSAFSRIITPAKQEFSGSAMAYIAELIAERTSTHYPPRVESYTSRSMDFGRETEDEACRAYGLMTGLELGHGGFFTTDDGRFGSSPDRRVLEEGKIIGAVEIKCPEAKTHMKWLLGPTSDKARLLWEKNNKVPLDHLCQIHGELAVTELPWIDFFSYASGCPDVLIRCTPNDFTMKLRVAMERFWSLYTAAIKEVSAA